MGYASQPKLFKVGHTMPAYFNSKKAAKTQRDELNMLLSTHERRFAITRGPDHWRGESFNRSKRTRGSRSAW